MELQYLEFNFDVNPVQPGSDVLMAQLGAIGFESFSETEKGVLAYIQEKDFKQETLKEVAVLQESYCKISYTFTKVEQQNWNQLWESNFEPIVVDDLCSVRAPFHTARPDLEYDLVIEPKMSFGTGHHETTHLMMKHLLKEEVKGKSVLDMGCGTGVLAILAEKRGAQSVEAIDIDNWCYLNSLENIDRNNCKKIKVLEGGASLLENKKYEIIIANINRNILLEDIPVYAGCLEKGGSLFLSGFYTEDVALITEKCNAHNLVLEKKFERNNWVGAKFVY